MHALLRVPVDHVAVVLEVFSEWCGPCKSVLPTFKRIRLDKDDDAALQFLTVRLRLHIVHTVLPTAMFALYASVQSSAVP